MSTASDTKTPTIKGSASPRNATSDNDVPLSVHAEDTLANVVGKGIALVNDSEKIPTNTVQSVLQSMTEDREELIITLEYGTGESGIDQASWEIEVSSLQRAFLRKQKKAEITALSDKLLEEIKIVRRSIEPSWKERTTDFRTLMITFERPSLSRQEIDDFQHRVFGRDEYLNYLEAVISGTDSNRLLNAVGNLRQMAIQFEADIEDLIDPSKVDNNKLADEIIYFKGDIDKLALELERDFPSAVFRQRMAEAMHMYEIMNQDYLKSFKLWAHSFDLNLREVVSTERASDGAISEKSKTQLREMLQAGADQVNSILQVL